MLGCGPSQQPRAGGPRCGASHRSGPLAGRAAAPERRLPTTRTSRRTQTQAEWTETVR